MNKNLVTWSDYETPSVKTLDILSEGVLCASFDENNYTERFYRDPVMDEL